jgi:hypothetical protein
MPKVAIQNISLVRRYDWQNRLEFDPCRKIVLTKLPGPTRVCEWDCMRQTSKACLRRTNLALPLDLLVHAHATSRYLGTDFSDF